MGAMIMPKIQNLESTLRAGAVPQVPQFRPAAVTQPSLPTATISLNRNSASTSVTANKVIPPSVTNGGTTEKSLTKEANAVPHAVKTVPSSNSSAGKDPLGDARSKIQDEIAREFTALMASGSLSASEAASLATKKVMQKHGHLKKAAS